jgi:transcriptional antiterminator Rof (Rho-off)
MYVSVADYRAYAALTGVTLPVADAACELQLVQSSQYIDSLESRLIGTRTVRDQDYAYPRADLTINGFDYDDDEIPLLVEHCQMALALEINAGVDLYADATTLPVIREKVDVLEVQYATPSSAQAKPRQSVAMAMLRQLMRSSTMSIPLVRV